MEDYTIKKGALYLQQQRFGKRWRKVWCVLFRESLCSVSRLEIYDFKDDRTDASLRKHQDKKVIRLSSCLRVSEVDVEGCPKDTSPFLIETNDKIYVFASDRLLTKDWTQRLCENAFPMKWSDPGLKRGSSQRNSRIEPESNMEDNSLYDTGVVPGVVPEFRVLIRRSDASDRCRLKGEVMLRAESDALLLLDRSGQVMFTWPYRYLRRFGRDKTTFSFEAGRRCDSGEGSFEFDTKSGNALFAVVESAIHRQRVGLDGSPSCPQRQTSMGLDNHPPISRSLPPRPPDGDRQPDPVYSLVNDSPAQRHHLCRLEPPVDKTLTSVKSLTLENRETSIHRKNQVKTISSCPLPSDPCDPPTQMYSQVVLDRKKKQKTHNGSVSFEASRSLESEYSLPFDLLTPDPAESQRPPMADPLYDSIDEFQIRNIFHKHDHIYDEPEGCSGPGPVCGSKMASAVAAVSLYDAPEEMRGEAWRIMGTEQDPLGHEIPYNPRSDDYAVPKQVLRALGPEEEENQDEQGLSQDSHPEEEHRAGPPHATDSPYHNIHIQDSD